MTIAEVFVASYRWNDMATAGKIFNRLSCSPIDGYRWGGSQLAREADRLVSDSHPKNTEAHARAKSQEPGRIGGWVQKIAHGFLCRFWL